MSKPLQYRPDKSSGPLFATALVLFMGLIGCLAVYFGGGGNDMLPPSLMGIAFVLLLGMAIAMRDRPEATEASRWSLLASRRVKTQRQVLVQIQKPTASEYGTQRPSTAEEVRDLKDDTKTWVPSRKVRES